MPTYEFLPRFRKDLEALSEDQRAAFRASVAQLARDLRARQGFGRRLRVKGVRGHPGVFEMTWAPDGRATFHYGQPVQPADTHIVWRRVGTHAILDQP